MNFVLTNNGIVQQGPNNWNKLLFQSELEELGITYELPKTNTDFISISESVKIYPIDGVDVPNYNTKTEQLAGPYYTYTNNSARITYSIVPKSIEIVKLELKGIVSSNRYALEIAGTTTTIQGNEVTLDTSREGRSNYSQQFLIMADTDTVTWKFSNKWLTLTKSELGQCVSAISAHVQAQFQWELDKIVEIDACNTLEELDNVAVTK